MNKTKTRTSSNLRASPSKMSVQILSPTYSEGIRYSDVQAFVSEHDLPKVDIRVALGISQSTQFRYQKGNRILNPTIVDRFKRIQRMYQQALDLFEDLEETKRWISTPKDYLEGITPLQALATDSGSKRVEEMLYRAEYGMFG